MKLQAARRRKLANYSPDRGGARGVADRRLHTKLLQKDPLRCPKKTRICLRSNLTKKQMPNSESRPEDGFSQY